MRFRASPDIRRRRRLERILFEAAAAGLAADVVRAPVRPRGAAGPCAVHRSQRADRQDRKTHGRSRAMSTPRGSSRWLPRAWGWITGGKCPREAEDLPGQLLRTVCPAVVLLSREPEILTLLTGGPVPEAECTPAG